MSIGNAGSIGGISPTQTAVPTLDDKRAKLQALLVKKAFDLQSGTPSQPMPSEGKGQTIDIRV